MFNRIREFELIDIDDRLFRPRAYGDPQPNGTWDGWLVFFPLSGGPAIAPSVPETTESSSGALSRWAAGLAYVDLSDALARAMIVAEQPSLIDQLTDEEYEALEDAERLEAEAEVERLDAAVDEAATRAARADAEAIRRERRAAEEAVASAAPDARDVAADAERRRRVKDRS